MIEQYSVPLNVKIGDQRFQHEFIMSEVCPVNLLGRYLLCKMNASIKSGLEECEITASQCGLFPTCSKSVTVR